MINHTTPDCRTKQIEFADHSDRPLIGSESHKRLVSLFSKRDMIPKSSELQELRRLHRESSSSSSSTYAPKKPFVKKDWKNRGTVTNTILTNKLPIPTPLNLISVFLTFSSQAKTQRRINVEGLLDTGCLAGDSVARRIVEKYNIQPILQATSYLSVCSGLDNICYDMSKSVIIRVNFSNERANNTNTFEFKAII